MTQFDTFEGRNSAGRRGKSSVVTLAGLLVILGASFLAGGCASSGEPMESTPKPQVTSVPPTGPQPPFPRPAHPREVHLRNVRQLTFGGENAEAYFSADGEQLIFQSTRPPYDCDQIFIMNVDGSELRLVSTGTGRTTCAYFAYPDDERVIYASTHLGGKDCPPVPDRSQGYVWPLYASYDIFAANPDGSDLVRLTDTTAYDAEATYHPAGDRIIFTSTRDGDLELYSMAADGSDVKRLTNAPGYDGGAFYSWDGEKIVFRANRPEGEELADYRRLLAQGLVRPADLEVFVMDADGSNMRQVTRNGAANFCPFFHPDGQRIIFSSNFADPSGREFDLYIINIDGTGLERVTYESNFDGFPMFSPDGKSLVWCSNRYNAQRGETNVFIADWVD